MGRKPRNKFTKNNGKTEDANSEIEAPSVIRMSEWLRSRVDEIATMEVLSRKSMGNDQITEKLPRLMRRRAASHNYKRLPRRLHATAMQMMKKGLFQESKTKRPSRRHRRRPSRLRQGHTSLTDRNTTVRTLDTHVWHAKRFRVAQDLFGVRVPLRPNDKGSRAAYRSSRHYCVIQDTSYMRCVQISGGSLRDILSVVTPFLPPSVDLITDGRYTLDHVLYKKNSYPYEAIAPVSLMFNCEGQDATRTLWLWTHPADTENILEQFKQHLSTDVIVKEEEAEEDGSITTARVSVKVLADLCRLSLIGPASVPILNDVLHLPDTVHESDWADEDIERSIDIHTRQLSYFTRHLCHAMPNSIIPITIKDPRLVIPKRKTTVQSLIDSQMDKEPSTIPLFSNLWSEEERSRCQRHILTVNKINDMRAACLTSGTDLEMNRPIYPLILIRNSADNGFDVIGPRCLAMPLWIPLIYHGARATGIRCQDDIRINDSLLRNPDDYPDTMAGRSYGRAQDVELRLKHDRYPPAKRPNYDKLKRAVPFQCDWSLLIPSSSSADAIDSGKDFYVLRDIGLLRKLSDTGDWSSVADPDRCLVPVSLEMEHKGVPRRFAEIFSVTSTTTAAEDGEQRHLVGYVVNGNYCYGHGKGRGIGFLLANRMAAIRDRRVDLKTADSEDLRKARFNVLVQ